MPCSTRFLREWICWEKTDKAELLKREAGKLHAPVHPGVEVALDA